MRFEIEGHAEDHARIYDQGAGSQYTSKTDHVYAFPGQRTGRSKPMNIANLPFAEGLERVGAWGASRSIADGSAVPQYIRRDCDEQIPRVFSLARPTRVVSFC